MKYLIFQRLIKVRVWNDMKGSKWLQSCHFRVNYAFKLKWIGEEWKSKCFGNNTGPDFHCMNKQHFLFFRVIIVNYNNPDFDKSKNVFANEIWQLWWSQKWSMNNDLNHCFVFFMESYCMSSENLEYRYVITPPSYHCRLTTLTKCVFHVRTTEKLQYPYE